MDKTPRILFILHLPPPVHGASMVGKMIRESKLINNTYDCYYINESTSTDLSHVGRFRFYKFIAIFRHWVEIAREIKRIRPNLIYITPAADFSITSSLRFGMEFLIINFFRKKKLIHFHNKGDRDTTINYWHKWYYKIMFRNAYVIFLSEKLTDQFDWILEKNKILICPNGVAESLNYPPNTQRNNPIPKLLFLSNLIESKGVVVLLDAIKILIDKGISLTCDFIGAESEDINQKRFDKEVSCRNIQDYVKYHGKKYGSDKEFFLKNADIFVFPTYYHCECFPLVLLEAMEYKLPLISTDNGAITDIIENGVNGIVCRMKDVCSLANAIESLVNDKDKRIKMGEEGYQMFRKKYTLSVFEQNMIDCINIAL